MNREELNNMLSDAGLTKKSFCAIVGLNYITINNWGSNNKNIPLWVKSWLELYIETKDYREFRELLKKSGICKDKISLEDQKEEI